MIQLVHIQPDRELLTQAAVNETKEYVCVVDRSGSMSGTAMKNAKEALKLFIHSLPSENTFVNVYSFGSNFSCLWETSQPYTTTGIAQCCLDHLCLFVTLKVAVYKLHTRCKFTHNLYMWVIPVVRERRK